jgi:hypothetical protein
MTFSLGDLETTILGRAMRGETEGFEFLFPIVECFHVLALAVVFGSIIMVDLRLLGFVARESRVSKVAGELLPYTWTAFGLAALSGGLMFISKPMIYINNLDFRLKFLCMLGAGLNMLIFHAGVYRRIDQWDFQHPTPLAARVAGGVSISLWVSIVFLGRWIGFTT